MDSYCTIYVNDNNEVEYLKDTIQLLFECRFCQFNTLTCQDFSITLTRNPDYSPSLETVFPDGFLYFLYRIEITFDEQVEILYSVKIIEKILLKLWEIGSSAVASADYEGLLPENGGYKSSVIPWSGVRGN